MAARGLVPRQRASRAALVGHYPVRPHLLLGHGWGTEPESCCRPAARAAAATSRSHTTGRPGGRRHPWLAGESGDSRDTAWLEAFTTPFRCFAPTPPGQSSRTAPE